MRDNFFGIIAILLVSSLILFIGYEAYEHPCIQYQAVFVPGHYETYYRQVYCGKDCYISVPYEEWINPYWRQQCIAYGDRDKGDVDAPFAPIPAEREK